MYIRRTKTKTADHRKDSHTYRIVESVREGMQVKQRTLLNLGKDFAIEPAHWPLLAARIEQLLQGSAPRQAELFHLADDVGQLLEAAADRYSDLIIAKLAQPVAIADTEGYHRVNINHIEAAQARSIGAETLACHAVRQLQLDQKLTALGFNKIDSATALGSIIGRMIAPGSELQSHDWLQSRTALGELLDHDYGSTRLTRIHKRQFSSNIKRRWKRFSPAQDRPYSLNRSIVLYDLTNTYFEGQCAQNPKAQFGRSKEKRSDCPWVTLRSGSGWQSFPAQQPGISR